MEKCKVIDPISEAQCTNDKSHFGDHLDESVDGISIRWPNQLTVVEYIDHIMPSYE